MSSTKSAKFYHRVAQTLKAFGDTELHKGKILKKIRMALASDFSIANEQVVLTPDITNMAISRKDRKVAQALHLRKVRKVTICP